jgi:hypothetical protein
LPDVGVSRALISVHDGSVIAAASFQEVFGDDAGVAVRCEDEATIYLVEPVSPTWGEYLDVNEEALPTKYEAAKVEIMNVLALYFDDDALPFESSGMGSIEALKIFLNSTVDDYYLLERWGAKTTTQYTPGFMLLNALPQNERKKFREMDLGGPASSIPSVLTKLSHRDLQDLIDRYRLPFKVDNEDQL